MPTRHHFYSLWWLIHKDLTRELRTLHVWAGTVLLGLVLVFLLAMQVDLLAEEKARVAGGLLWLVIYFSGTLACDRSFACERDAGCWQTLTLYPIAPSVLFLAKMAVNFAALGILELVLAPAFVVLADVPLDFRPGPLLLSALLGNVGFAALGTLVGGLTSGLQHRGGLLALLVMPLAAPVMLGAAETTRLALAGETGSMWRLWIQLLAVCAVLFTAAGVLLFEFVVEE
jgi:heme exporter protein B